MEFKYSDHDGAKVTATLHAAGCTGKHVVSKIDEEAGLVCWFGIEDRSGRIFEQMELNILAARHVSSLHIARQIFMAYEDWNESGRPYTLKGACTE